MNAHITLNPKQPQTDTYLSDLEYNRIFLKKIKHKISELDPIQDAMLVVDLKSWGRHQKKILNAQQRQFDKFINDWKEQSCSNEFEEECFTENQAKLDNLTKQYLGIYEASPLLRDADGQWRLDVNKDELNKVERFYPSQIQAVYSEQGSSPINVKTTCITSERRVSLSESVFMYDDGNDHNIDPKDMVLNNRFVWYWDKSSSDTVLRYGIAITSNFGKPVSINIESRFFKEEHNQFILFQPQAFQGLPAVLHTKVDVPTRSGGRTKPKPSSSMPIATLSRNEVSVKNNAQFYAFPLDKFPFKSKPLDTLMFNTGCFAEDIIKGEAAQFKRLRGPDEIKVHCSLPEWDFRLRQSLNKVQRQIGEYNMFLTDYMARLEILNDMINLVKFQTEFPYKGPDDINYIEATQQLAVHFYLKHPMWTSSVFWGKEDKAKLGQAKNQRELYQALCGIRDKMVMSVDTEESFLMFSQQHKGTEKQKLDIDKAQDRLYALLTAPALRRELTRYIDSLTVQLQDEAVVKKITDEGLIPGPDTEEEGNWCVIFNTIAECYGALSSSAKYRQKLFDEQIAPNINVMIANDTGHQVEKEFNEVWKLSNLKEKTRTNISKDGFLSKQTYLKPEPEIPKDNLLSYIFDNNTVTTLEALWEHRGLVVPAPGAPCVLQVILSSYSSEVMTHLTKRVKKFAVSPLRFFNAVMRHFGVKGLVPSADLTDIFTAYAITQNTSKNRELVVQGRKVLRLYSREIASGEGKHSKDLFDHTLDSAASPYQGVAYAKVLYVFYNFTINTQNALAIEEQAKAEKWSAHKTNLELVRTSTQLISSHLQVASDGLNMVKSIEIALARLKTKGPIDTGTLRFGAVGQILDKLAIPITVLTLVSTALDIYIDDDSDTDANLFAKGASLLADLSIFVGWLMGTSALMIVGTAITVVIVVHEMIKLFRSLNQTTVQTRLLAQWELFKNELDPAVTKAYLEKVASQSGIKEDLEFDSTVDLESALKVSPINMLKSLAPELIYEVDEKLADELWDIFPQFSYVNVGNMSWRAVVPLHLLGYSNKVIGDLVTLDPTLQEANGIQTVEDIINYYKAVQAQALEHPDHSLDSDQSTHIYIGPGMHKAPANKTDWGIQSTNGDEIEIISIAQLLETGLFTPPERSEQRFFLGNIWAHPSFQIPKLYVESINGENDD